MLVISVRLFMGQKSMYEETFLSFLDITAYVDYAME